MLIHFGVIPYIVFDGDYLPSKAATEVERAKKREESRRKGLELYRLNKPSQAHLELQKAVEVTPEMAVQLIEELKKAGVQYVVAPYEADAQLAYLERQGIIQGILSEDSDLLVFGAKRLLTKLDQYGDCIEINRADFTACREISLVGWSDAEFRRMAILSGCDYLASINRMGLKSAYRLVRKHKTIEKILRMLSFDGQYHVPPGYLEAFYKAELTFLHQRVFCPLKKDVVMMTDLHADAHPEDFSFIGGEIEQKIAIGVANGDLDPMTKNPIRVKAIVKTTPKTPWGNPRRNTVDACSDTKAVKSIDSFFKPKRSPLAELDPNSFTPSPTQERLLRQANGLTWESNPAPAGPPSLRPSHSMPSSGPRSAFTERVSENVTSVDAALTMSTLSKRRRLCTDPSDGIDLGSVVASESGRSQFFAPNIPDPSLSTGNRKKQRKGKSADITIWSDDSIEDVMAELPDASDCPQPSRKGKIDIFRNDIEEKTEDERRRGSQGDEILKVDSQQPSASKGIVKSEMSSNLSATSFTSSTPTVAALLDKHVTAELKALTKKYTYQPEAEQIEMKNQTERSKEVQAGVSVSEAILKPPMLRQRNMTPLARLGLGAINRSRSYSSLFNRSVDCPGSVIHDSTSNKNSATLTKPILGLPLAYSIGPDASNTKGSEDAIIPDSEDESGSASEGGERAKPIVDFGRFAFTG